MKVLEAVDSLAVFALRGAGLLLLAALLPLLLPLAFLGWLGKQWAGLIDGRNR